MATKNNHMRKRLNLMCLHAQHHDLQATVAQISAAYATMACGDYDDELWGMLLTLAGKARPVSDDCYNCKNGRISTFEPGTGFVWVECPKCHGTKIRLVHKPYAGELDSETVGSQYIPVAAANKAARESRVQYDTSSRNNVMKQVAQAIADLTCL